VALFAIVFAVNLLPAFGPPTWAVLVFTRLHWHLNPIALVLLGASAAMIARYILARVSRASRSHLPTWMKSNLGDAQRLIERRRIGAVTLFALFVVSPLPSAQLFVAAGLLDVPLGILTVAFFLGRLVSYSIYVGIATLADRQLGAIVGQVFGSPWSIALQIGLVAAVCLLPLVHWGRFLRMDDNPRDAAD